MPVATVFCHSAPGTTAAWPPLESPYALANGFAAVVLVLLLLDPTRPLALVFVLLSLAVVCAIVPAFLRR